MMLVKVLGYVSLMLLIGNMITGGLLIQKNGQLNVLKLDKLHNEFIIAQMVETIENQNGEIEKYRIDLETANTRWDSREPVVEYIDRWRTKYETKYAVKEDGNESCKDMLEYIRSSGF